MRVASFCKMGKQLTLNLLSAGSFSLEVGTDAPVKAKKKRSYANAYTRKGQGLSAAIESMKAQSAVKEEIPEVGEKPPPRKRARQKRVKEESALEGESLQPIEAIPAIVSHSRAFSKNSAYS